MSRLFRKNADGQPNEVFNKETILQQIKEQLPEPWFWCTIQSRLADEKNHLAYSSCVPKEAVLNSPIYDLIIMRNKNVNEEINYVTPFSAYDKNIHTVYSITMGIMVKSPIEKKEILPIADDMVNISLIISSVTELFNYLKEVDSQEGGIKKV